MFVYSLPISSKVASYGWIKRRTGVVRYEGSHGSRSFLEVAKVGHNRESSEEKREDKSEEGSNRENKGDIIAMQMATLDVTQKIFFVAICSQGDTSWRHHT
ncbi:hypothetical protein Q3G72_010944 [Acer saccharum]|nr:hypothetical protein Q3G72_010944 [Acer saccharum]